jgi:hypothetical protein
MAYNKRKTTNNHDSENKIENTGYSRNDYSSQFERNITPHHLHKSDEIKKKEFEKKSEDISRSEELKRREEEYKLKEEELKKREEELKKGHEEMQLKNEEMQRTISEISNIKNQLMMQQNLLNITNQYITSHNNFFSTFQNVLQFNSEFMTNINQSQNTNTNLIDKALIPTETEISTFPVHYQAPVVIHPKVYLHRNNFTDFPNFASELQTRLNVHVHDELNISDLKKSLVLLVTYSAQPRVPNPGELENKTKKLLNEGYPNVGILVMRYVDNKDFGEYQDSRSFAYTNVNGKPLALTMQYTDSKGLIDSDLNKNQLMELQNIIASL